MALLLLPVVVAHHRVLLLTGLKYNVKSFACVCQGLPPAMGCHAGKPYQHRQSKQLLVV